MKLNQSTNKIEYSYYKKPVASRMVTMKTSAMSKNVKFATLTQDCFKRFHNTCENTPFDEKVEILNEFMLDLCASGYNEKDRLAILNGGYNTHDKLRLQENLGKRPYYRPSNYNKKERKISKFSKKNDWFKQENVKYSTVMFIDATPGDRLLKIFKEIEDKHRVSDEDRIKFISRSGIKLENLVQERDPL